MNSGHVTERETSVPYTSDQIPRPAGPPVSASPPREFLASVRNGVDQGYVVLPRALAESMPLAWQQQFAHVLAELHQAYGHLPWPVYRVVPSRPECLADLDEEQLAEVGCLVEIDGDGELRYRDRDGRVIDNPEQHEVLVSCVDPIQRARPPNLPHAAHPPHAPHTNRQAAPAPVWPS